MNRIHIEIPVYDKTTHPNNLRNQAYSKEADEYMLFHWFDFALEADFGGGKIYHPDARRFERKHKNSLWQWPIEIEFLKAYAPWKSLPDGDAIFSVESLNERGATLLNPDLLEIADLHWEMVNERLQVLWSKYMTWAPDIAIGRRTKIHPTAKLQDPYWIGEGTLIGPNVVIGPNTTIGDHCVISEGAEVSSSHIGDGNRVGAGVRIINSSIEDGIVINRSRRVIHESIDPSLVGRVMPRLEASLVLSR